MASAFYLLLVTFIGLALCPFCMGALSDYFAATGLAPGDALRLAMLWGLGTRGIALVMLACAVRHLSTEEANRLDRARRGRARVNRAYALHPDFDIVLRMCRETHPRHRQEELP